MNLALLPQREKRLGPILGMFKFDIALVVVAAESNKFVFALAGNFLCY